MNSRTNQYQENNIKALSEQLGLLRITEENASEKITEYIDEISVVLASATV